MPRIEKVLRDRDARRDIGQELLQAIRDVKAGRRGATMQVEANRVVGARHRPIR